MSWIARLGRWLRDQVVQEVPESLAVCEFDCDRPDCRTGDWERCERRHGPVHLDEAPSPSPERSPVAAPQEQ